MRYSLEFSPFLDFPDTNELRKKMRVVLPALSVDDDDVSEKTAFSCTGMNIYRLESFVSGVYKRSIPEELDDHGKFAVFSGSKLVIMNLVNIDEVEQQEKSKR